MSAKKKGKLPTARAPVKSRGPSMTTLIAVAALAVIVVAIFIWFQRLGERAPAPALPSTTSMELGPAAAPVVVEEFADFQCPACKFAAEGVVRRLQAEATAPESKFRLVFRSFPFIGAESQRMAEASVCAAGQDKFVPYYEKLFAEQRGENSGYMTRDRLVGYAQELGLNTQGFSACLDQGQAKGSVAADRQRGTDYGVRGTPTFVVNGKVVEGQFTYENVKSAINAAIAAAPAR